MTVLINLFGGPGSGKSTTAAHLFVLLKEKGKRVELVTEYVKQWSWEKREIVYSDQFYFFGQQARKEYSLFDKVDYIVTDAPTAIVGYFSAVFGNDAQRECFETMVSTYYETCKEQGVILKNFWINRMCEYDTHGRFQTANEALKMDTDQIKYIRKLGLYPSLIDGDNTAARNILKEIL